MTNPATARKLVLLSVMGLLIIATYKGRTGKVPTSTRLWGTGWLAIMLGVAADVAPQVAGPFALLILAGSITSGGDKVLTDLLSRTGATTSGSGNDHPAGPHGPIGKPSKPPKGNAHPAGPHGPLGSPTNSGG